MVYFSGESPWLPELSAIVLVWVELTNWGCKVNALIRNRRPVRGIIGSHVRTSSRGLCEWCIQRSDWLSHIHSVLADGSIHGYQPEHNCNGPIGTIVSRVHDRNIFTIIMVNDRVCVCATRHLANYA